MRTVEARPRQETDLRTAIAAATNRVLEAKKSSPNGDGASPWHRETMRELLDHVAKPGGIEMLKELQNNA